MGGGGGRGKTICLLPQYFHWGGGADCPPPPGSTPLLCTFHVSRSMSVKRSSWSVFAMLGCPSGRECSGVTEPVYRLYPLRRRPVICVQDNFPFTVAGELEQVWLAVMIHSMLMWSEPIFDVEDMHYSFCGSVNLRVGTRDGSEEFDGRTDVAFVEMGWDFWEKLVHVFVGMAHHQKSNFDLKDIHFRRCMFEEKMELFR